MNISKDLLRQIIKEELDGFLSHPVA